VVSFIDCFGWFVDSPRSITLRERKLVPGRRVCLIDQLSSFTGLTHFCQRYSISDASQKGSNVKVSRSHGKKGRETADVGHG